MDNGCVYACEFGMVVNKGTIHLFGVNRKATTIHTTPKKKESTFL